MLQAMCMFAIYIYIYNKIFKVQLLFCEFLGCEWTVSVHTSASHEIEAEFDGRVSLTVYGDQGNTGPIIIGNLQMESFKPTNIAQSKVSCFLSLKVGTCCTQVRENCSFSCERPHSIQISACNYGSQATIFSR